MKKIKIVIAIILLPFAAMANKTDTELSAARKYNVYWAGIHIADLIAEVKDNKMQAIIESYGIAKEVSKYRSKTSSEFILNNGAVLPASFFTEFQQRDQLRKIDIKFSEDGIKHEQVTPPDNRKKRPAVPDILKKDAVDPLTAAVVAREKILESLANNTNKFEFNIYDGRRLSALKFNVYGLVKRIINGKSTETVKIDFKRYPLAGYTSNEMKRAKGEEPVITFYLEPGTLYPLAADAEAKLGTATLVMEKECDSLDSCMK